MQPLKVTFIFASPVVMENEYPLHLDALLSWARVQEAGEQGLENPWKIGSEDLPLARAGEGDSWVWQASKLVFTPKTPRELINMQRKSDPSAYYADFDQNLWSNDKTPKPPEKRKLPPTINTQSGQHRAYQYYVAYQWMEKAEAWCVGDADRVKSMLERLTHIGKRGRGGFGLISSVNVEPCQETDLWKLRVLPGSVPGLDGIEYAPVMSPPRAPYWDKLAQVRMLEPV